MADNHFKVDRGLSIRPQASAPSNPTNGDIYYDSTLLKFRKYENGAWSDFGSGGTSSSSGINYIANPGAEVDTSGWATYADAAGNVPVDGTGGTATNLTFSRSTSSPLRGAGMFSLAQANSTSLQGKGVSYDFTIDIADKAKSLSLTFDYNASSTFVAGNGITPPLNDGTTTTNAGNSDIEVFIYDVTNAILIPVRPQVITANGANNFSFKGTFQTASNSTSYRLIFHVATTSANATGWTFKFDNLALGPQALSQGPAMDDWTSGRPLTPSAAFGTVTSPVYETRRVGDSLEVVFAFTIGTVAAVNVSIALPAGLVVDSSKLPSNASGTQVGGAQQISTSGSASTIFGNILPMFYDGSTTGSIFITNLVQSSAFKKDTGSNMLGTGAAFVGKFSVPILGWSSNSVMSNDTDTRIIGAIAHVSSNISVTSLTPINFDVVDNDTHGAVTTGVGAWKFTAPVSGFYDILLTAGAGNASDIRLYKNGSVFKSFGTINVSENANGYCTTLFLVAGDFVDVRIGGTTTVSGGSGNSNYTHIAVFRKSGPASIAATDVVIAQAYISTNTTPTAGAQINFDTVAIDTTGAITTGSSWKFTAPVSGYYEVCGHVANNGPIQQNLNVFKNGSIVAYFTRQDPGAALGTGSTIVKLLAGDFIDLRGTNGGAVTYVGDPLNGTQQSYINIKLLK